MSKLGKQWMYSSFANSGRKAGEGILYDDYSETSGNPNYDKGGYPRFPNDHTKPEDLNGEVIIVQEGRKKDGK